MDATLPPLATEPTIKDSSGISPVELPAATDGPEEGERYTPSKVLGEGGMGEVQLCRDRRINRDVAMKVIRGEAEKDAMTRARFLREARVQGQLEHPAIVPVYDLGWREDGASYFTMKRVHGMTLQQVIAALAAGDAEARSRFTIRRLLTAFCSACLAVDFAHARGVIHRDLKPANLMLGDFGEVYVLDWGLAKLTGAEGPEAPTSGSGPRTAKGAILGTLGYMPPEQISCDVPLGPASDVYALGAILFEMLTLEPLIPRGAQQAMMLATLQGPDARLATRAPSRDLAPELEAICVRATSRDPRDRFASARELNDAVEAYLEGDRDHERRRAQSIQHAATARVELDAALSGAVAYEEGRGRAMRELNRALALDPENAEAVRTMLRLLTEPPREMPREVEAAVRGEERKLLRIGARLGGYSNLIYVLLLPLVWAIGILDWTPTLAAAAAMALSAAVSLNEVRRDRVRFGAEVAAFVLTTAGFALCSRIFGPFVLVPAMAATYSASLQAHPWRRERLVGLLCCCLVVALPVALEWLGLIAPSYLFADGRMIIQPQLMRFGAASTMIFLLLASLAIIVVPSLFIGRIRDELSTAQRRLALNAWHLQRLVPEERAAERSAV